MPWAFGGCLLISFTASAGPRLDSYDAPLRRLSTLNGGTVLTLPVPRSAAAGRTASLWQPLFEPYAVETAPQVPYALAFLDDPGLFPPAQWQSQHSFDRQLGAVAGRFLSESGEGAPQDHALRGTIPVTLAMLTAETPDGSTPSVPRAVSLSSVTPAPVEPEVITMPVLQSAALTTAQAIPLPPVKPVMAAHPAAPRYADLIDPEDMSREQRCLAEAVYFESRSESSSGQAAVAQVVLNRVKSGNYPDSVCGVVYQNRHRYLGCQFSFACEGRSLRITEPGPWKQAVKVARAVTLGQTYLPEVGDATHYHAKYVKPTWSRLFRKKDTIGQHIFYKPRPGQS